FVPHAGLRVRLTMRTRVVAAHGDPGFTVHLDNVGGSTIYVNPEIVSNLYIYTTAGTPVAPTSAWFAQVGVIGLKRGDVIALGPAQTLWRPVHAENHAIYDMGNGAAYSDRGLNGYGEHLMLGAGSYTARFVYVNTPDFPSTYSPRNIPEIWEGRVESEP